MVYEENLIPQIGLLMTCRLSTREGPAVVRWIHVDTIWNLTGQEYSLRVPKNDGH